ncbi:hypothetical protein ACPUYX_05605 [Desulfosporosinus sp. SYSU MS00001]|uniref:hypothetical protein n=1 Tax=Desulfosporosinus sp. SYSU MS00001 TaxID=3416284 RepID=UPI003CEC56D1
MLQISSKEFETELKACLNYVKQKQTGYSGLNLDFYDLTSEDFDPSEYDDIIIDDSFDDSFQVNFSPDHTDESIELSLREFIELIDETRTAKLIDNKICLTEKRCLVRVTAKDYTGTSILDILLSNNPRVLEVSSNLDEVNFSCSLVNGVTIFGLMVHFADDYDKYYPSVVNDDMFVEIIFDKPMRLDQVDTVLNSYIFELNASHNITLEENPRPELYFDEVDEEEISQKTFPLRPLLFGKGIDEVLKLFNIGMQNYDYCIIQYAKVIEFVSQTVIRQEITNKARAKLLSQKALNPDANYIKGLEQMFVDFKQKFDTDRSTIKATIKTCCDVLEVVDYAPDYLKKVQDLKSNLQKDKAVKETVLEVAFDQIADSISDTRNYIAHAKANYSLKGNECPENEKQQFVDMLRILAIQTIRWYSNIHEGSRIVN